MRWTVSSSFVVRVCPHVAVRSTHPASILSHCRAAETTFSDDHWTHSQHWTRGTCRLDSRPADLSCRSRTHQWSQTLATSVCFNCAISPMVERYFYMSPLCRCRQQQTIGLMLNVVWQTWKYGSWQKSGTCQANVRKKPCLVLTSTLGLYLCSVDYCRLPFIAF